ncbi:nuclear factor NF-kappa-B p110 subunit [Maniola hyperantus]|uniref:nuclear factor NF-kappa-B p110 subunit n=1 Tax=Aphantopus hyperantus TaxID=2795564 RepID=UPI002146EA08
MSTSETDLSDSNLESPFSQSDSPYSSPSQQVPQLANFISELSCKDTIQQRGNMPYLQIVEQPQNHFRFRYKSEMIGTHGCLLGKSTSSSKTKTHPTVELCNYYGQALLRCRLVRHDADEEHPHRLLEDDQDRDVTGVLPQRGSYRVAFSGIGIIHTAKKDVAALMYQKYMQDKHGSASMNENGIRLMCENNAKNINLNIVRLKFSAHDLKTDKEICPPVFSEPIHNMKSAATNDLKICRISRCYGRPQGSDDVFILVEKVNKKNIMIRFFELDERGERTWNATGTFLQSDVHHQYAIVFRTPQYRDPKISKDVTVYMELVRPSDGRTSEPKEFTYKAETIYKQNKKRKANSYSSYSSLESVSGGSVKLNSNDVPISVENVNLNNNFFSKNDEEMKEIPAYTIKVPEMQQVAPTSDSMMADAILYDIGSTPLSMEPPLKFSPMLGQPNVPAPPGLPDLPLHSSEMDRILERPIDSAEKKLFLDTDLSEYFKQFDGSLPDMNEPGVIDILKLSMFATDSGRAENVKDATNVTIKEESPKLNAKQTNAGEYSAVYKLEDGQEVKKLVKELCEIIRNKTTYKKQVVRSKLERLFGMRLCNGDTFLHMTLCSNQPSLEYIVKLIHSMKMTKLLNLKNNQMQTILHLAISNDSPKLVSFLVSKGCNPMEENHEGNNAVHYAVICQTCLGPLLEAVKTHGVSCDINAYNNEKQSPLHLAVIYASVESAATLLKHGASTNARDASGRTPLHLAATDDCLDVARLLVEDVPPSDIDVVDGKGYTALQIVCDGPVRPNTLEIAKLLLEKKADPMKHEEYNQAAWRLARSKPALLELLQQHADLPPFDDDVKSEPEDDFESADEGESEGGLAELPLYVEELAAVLDERRAWRELARRLRKESLLAWYGATPSPTRTLLNHIKECDDGITSKSLALLLDDIGYFDAAMIVRRYLND